jgi:hypothetical protein
MSTDPSDAALLAWVVQCEGMDAAIGPAAVDFRGEVKAAKAKPAEAAKTEAKPEAKPEPAKK